MKINIKKLNDLFKNNKKTTIISASACVAVGLLVGGCKADKHHIDNNSSVNSTSSSTSSNIQLDSDTKLDSSSSVSSSSKLDDSSSKAKDSYKITFERNKKDKDNSSSKNTNSNNLSNDDTTIELSDNQSDERRGEEIVVEESYDRDDVVVDSNGEVWVVDDSSYPDVYEETEYYDSSEASTGMENEEDDGYYHAPDGSIWTSREEYEEWQRYQDEIGTSYDVVSSLDEYTYEDEVIYLYPDDYSKVR